MLQLHLCVGAVVLAAETSVLLWAFGLQLQEAGKTKKERKNLGKERGKADRPTMRREAILLATTFLNKNYASSRKYH